jgi:hypothetical protein
MGKDQSRSGRGTTVSERSGGQAWNILSAEEKVAFFIRFAALDLAGLREGDRLNLTFDVRAALGWLTEWGDEISLEILRGTQPDVRKHLEEIAQRNELNRLIGLAEHEPFSDQSIPSELLERVQGLSIVPGKGSVVRADLRTAILVTLGLAFLPPFDPHRIRRCAAEGCTHLFLAEHLNQFFCTPRHAHREWRRLKGQEDGREAAGSAQASPRKRKRTHKEA